MAKAIAKEIHRRQSQRRPGIEKEMKPQPVADAHISFTEKLKNKVLLITGGDSGIGKAVSILFARQGADVAIVYLSETKDASDTKKTIEEYGRKCLLIKGDIRKENFCKSAVAKTIQHFGRVDILINNAAIHYET